MICKTEKFKFFKTCASRCHCTPKLHTGQAAWILCLSSLPTDSRPWFPNEMQNLLLSENKTLFMFQKWLGSPFSEDFWVWWLLMHWLQLQFTPCKALSSVWIGFAWQYSQACDHPCCLCTFSYPISFFQSTFYLVCFDTALWAVLA